MEVCTCTYICIWTGCGPAWGHLLLSDTFIPLSLLSSSSHVPLHKMMWSPFTTQHHLAPHTHTKTGKSLDSLNHSILSLLISCSQHTLHTGAAYFFLFSFQYWTSAGKHSKKLQAGEQRQEVSGDWVLRLVVWTQQGQRGKESQVGSENSMNLVPGLPPNMDSVLGLPFPC